MTDPSPETRVARHVCPLYEAGCGLEVNVRDGSVQLIRGDRSDVFSRGFELSPPELIDAVPVAAGELGDEVPECPLAGRRALSAERADAVRRRSPPKE